MDSVSSSAPDVIVVNKMNVKKVILFIYCKYDMYHTKILEIEPVKDKDRLQEKYYTTPVKSYIIHTLNKTVKWLKQKF